jgi:hypothetical protein
MVNSLHFIGGVRTSEKMNSPQNGDQPKSNCGPHFGKREPDGLFSRGQHCVGVKNLKGFLVWQPHFGGSGYAR